VEFHLSIYRSESCRLQAQLDQASGGFLIDAQLPDVRSFTLPSAPTCPCE
jgi:hypothetical protein